MVRETGHIVVRKCGRCNDCCSVLFFSGGRAMRRKTIWGRVCTAVLILSLLAGAVAVVFTGGRVRPPDPLPEQAQVLQPDRQERGGSGGTSDDVPLTQSPEPTEPSEEPDETETAEPSTEPDEPTDATSATQTTQTPEPSEEPTRSTGGGTEPTEEPGPAPTEAPGPEEPHIVTDLVSRVWRSGELDGDTLRFYAYAAGSGDLSLRVYYKESGSTANNGTRLLPADDRNFSVRLTLNQSYTFSLYLYRDGRRIGDAAVYYVSYRARLADDDEPEIGDAPPVITTSRDGRTDPVSVQTMTFVVWARTGTDGSPIYTSHLQVSMDGELLTNPTGSAASGYEYVLRFSAPLVGDEREYTLRILAWDDAGNSAMRTVKIVYQTVSEGDDIGEATIRIDATTVGLGIVDEETVRIKQGDTAAQTVLQMLEDCGYEAGYDGLAEKNGGFYLMRLTRGDLLYRAQVPERLWTLIQRDGISLTGAPGRDSLGQHDYTWGAGWMYDVNGYYPGKGLSEWMLGDGDVLTLRFTLAWGKDIDGFGATGGGYGVLSSYCYVWRDGQEIPLGHDWQETARVEPTETEDGYADYVCTKCAETRRDVLPRTGTVDPTDPTEPTDPTDPTNPTNPTDPTDPTDPTEPADPTENENERSMFLETNAEYSDPAAVRCTAGGLRRKIGACKGTRGLPGTARRARGLPGGPRSGAGGQLHRRLARHGAAGLRCEREL